MLCVINTLVSISTVELPDDDDSVLILAINRFIRLVDALTITIFCVDIILKWIDGFFKFWKNKWNVFELMITVVVNLIIVVNLGSPNVYPC